MELGDSGTTREKLGRCFRRQEKLESVNADLLEALEFYMLGHSCASRGECPSKEKAKQAIEKAKE